MPSWTDFLLPHPEPHTRTTRTPPSSPPSHPHPNAYPNSPYTQGSASLRVRHHLSAQGYLQPPPRSRYRDRPAPNFHMASGSGSSSAQSSVQDLALRLVVSASAAGHDQLQKKRARADSAVITSASCTSFGCASTRGRSSWQVVAEAFSSSPKGKELDRKGKGKEKGKHKERSPPPRIGALAFEVAEDDAQEEEPESELETDWENVSMEEVAGISGGALDEGWRYDWGPRKIGLAISQSLLRSRSGDNLDRHNRHWSGRGGRGGSEEGTSSRAVGVGVGRRRETERGKETPRGSTQQRDVSDSEAKEIAIGGNATDAVDQIRYGVRSGGIGLGDGVGNRPAPELGIEKHTKGKTPVISINGVELVDGITGSLSSPKRRSSSKTPSPAPEQPSSSLLPTSLSSDLPPGSGLSSALPSSSSSTSSQALSAAEVSPPRINKQRRRHRPDHACAIDDDTGLQYSVHSAAGCSSSSSSGVDCNRAGPGNSQEGPVIQEEGRRGGKKQAVDGYAHGDTHANGNGTMTSTHERGRKFKREEPGDHIIDNNVGVEDAAVDDGDIDSVIACDLLPLFDLTHHHHHHHRLLQLEDSEDTPVVRSQPLPLAHTPSTAPPQSRPPDSPLDSAPTPRPVSPSISQPKYPGNDSSVQSLHTLPSSVYDHSLHPDVGSDMGLLNLGIVMVRTPLALASTPGTRPESAHTRIGHIGGGRSAASIPRVSTSPPISAASTGAAAVAESNLHPRDSASVSAGSVASKSSSKSSTLSKAAKKSSRSKSLGSLDASSSTSSSHSDVAASSQPPPSTTVLPPTLDAPRVVSPLAFDPATYFDLSSVTLAKDNVKVSNFDLEHDGHVDMGLRNTVDEASPMSSSILPPVLASMTLEVPEEVSPATQPPSLPPPPTSPSTSCPEPHSHRPDIPSSIQNSLTFAPVAPLAITKKNPQGTQSTQKQKPASTSSSSVASLLARRFNLHSKSGGNLRGSYSQSSSPGASRPSSPSPLRNESFESKLAEVVSMLENVTPASGSADASEKEELESRFAPLPQSAPPLGRNSTPTYPSSNSSATFVPPTSALSSSSPTAPSAWTTQRPDLSRSPSTLPSSSASSEYTLFGFDAGISSSSSSGLSSSGSKASTPATSPGPQLEVMAGPLGGSLAKRWRKWSNNLGVWEREGQKDKEQQDIGTRSSFSVRSSANANTGTSQGQIPRQKQLGRSPGGEGGVVGGIEGGASKAASPEATREGLAEAFFRPGEDTGDTIGDEGTRIASASSSIGTSLIPTAMPYTVPTPLPPGNVPAPTSRKLVKPRPNLQGASIDDQHHNNLQHVLTAGGVPAASVPPSSLTTKKPKFTLGDAPGSPKAASFSSHSTTHKSPASTHGSTAVSTTVGSSTTNSLARRDTFRPPLIRRDAVVTPEQATRRWTLASAIMDEAISDEGLLKELERIRVMSEWDRRRTYATETEKEKRRSVDRRTRTLSLNAVHEGQQGGDAGQMPDEVDHDEEVRLWEIDVGLEIWEGREGMLAREREREMERARIAERQRLDKEKEHPDGDAASISTGSTGHSSSSTSAENSTDTTPETTPAFSPSVSSPGFAPSSQEPPSATKSASPNSTSNKTNMTTSLVKQPAPTWLAAQRALLICRELILTERRYLGLMNLLLLDTSPSTAGYVAQYQSHAHTGMQTSASTPNIPALQQHYQGIQQQLQYDYSVVATTHASLTTAHPSSGSQQTHVLVGPAPPARMLSATMPLADTTTRFLRAIEGAPSVGGVAKAFVDHEAEIGEVYVAWCREVGAWFADRPTTGIDAAGSTHGGGLQWTSKAPSPPGSTDGHTSHGHEDGAGGSSTIRLVHIPPLTPPLPGIPPYAGAAPANAAALSSSPTSSLKRVATSWRRSMTSIPSLVGGSSSSGGLYGSNVDSHTSERKHEKEKDPLIRATTGGESSPPSPTTADFVVNGRASGSSSTTGANAGVEAPPAKPLRKLGVRDLAILPTQRVMRYVLLYRDLLAHTPATASSRELVERALAAATRIADNCDRAQGHSAFVAPNAASSPSSALSPNPSNTSNPKNVISMPPSSSASGSGMSSGAAASRSGSGASNSSNTSGGGWRRKGKSRSRTASLAASPIPVLAPMTAVMRTTVAQKT